ncbi:MAG: hypothetical protein U0174_25215 [Polyangiaceae bacterium]
MSLASSAIAAPADREACLNSSEQGQKLRQQGKLQDAQKQFQICAQRECPGVVQRDCTQWLQEVSSALPTVTLSVQDEKGRDVIDVQVSIDGKNILSKLDGKTIPVDPGVHTFKFEVEGKAPIEERVLISEGDKAKKVSVAWKPTTGSGTGTGTGTGSGTGTGTGTGTGDTPAEPSSSGHTIYPWFLVGGGAVAGVVGAVLYFGGMSDFPSECVRGDDKSCKTDGLSESERTALLDRAKSADNRWTAGLPIMIGGGVLIAAGLTWFFLEPSGHKKKPTPPPSGATLRPSLGFGYAGISGTF